MIEVIPAALAGERIDRVVAMIAQVSRTEAARMIDEGLIGISGVTATTRSRRVEEGDTVQIPDVGGKVSVGITPDPSVSFEVVHHDDHVIVVDKPAGLVVHPGSGHPGATLVNGILSMFPDVAGVGDPDRPGVVHRLDKGTSGLMVVARSPEAYERLVGALSRREVTRTYKALVKGLVGSPTGVIDAPIGRSSREPTKMCVSAGGREARTRYERSMCFAHPLESTLLTCHLETGRTHQIRVHLSAIGHPVVGDARYGGAGAGAAVGIDRPFLHACALRFDHPVTGEPIGFESELPADLRDALGRLEAVGDGGRDVGDDAQC